ncbi:MAG TPA: glutamate racemase [Acidimicrobiia bacterium]|nr:glutamate racemase [Acidimicrobiia bacterium]
MFAMIGVFDSGVGGMSILAEIRRLLPGADLVYVADQAAAPYGVRTLGEVEQRCRLVAGWLLERGSAVVTIACNTASAAALHQLRAAHPEVAFVGMEPAMKPASEATRRGTVGVVATAATFQGKLFASAVDRFAAGVEIVTAACPDWVELVEAGQIEGSAVEQSVSECLEPMREAGVDVLVLACTHYPALRPVIERVMGPGVAVIDPGPAVARQTARVARSQGADSGAGTTDIVSTGDTSSLLEAARSAGIDATPALLPLV